MTVDKQKLLAWLEQSAKNNALSQAFYAFDAVTKEVSKGSFDISQPLLVDAQKMSETLFEIVESAIYQLEKLEDLLDMPGRGCTRNHFNALMRTLKEGVTNET